jgi:alpha-beta hydrolase superfamily lysophospholipase
MLVRHDVRADVTAAVPDLPAAPHEIAATVIADPEQWPPRVAMFGFPGGGYSRAYFDLDIPGHAGYSQAEHHASRGWLVVTVDHLGVGQSSLPDASRLSFEVCAAANDAAVRELVKRLVEGTLAPDLDAVSDRPFVIGAGQSMGGCLSIVAQARHRTFDALAVLGFSAIHTALPMPDGGWKGSDVARGRVGDFAASTAEMQAARAFHYGFHLEDVPADIRAADVDTYPLRLDGAVPTWASATMPDSAMSMLTPGVVASEAAAIDVPVLTVGGERDVVADLHAEPAAYPACPDVTAVLLRGSAHMHNFAETRQWLWRRLHGWVESLAALAPEVGA